MNAYVLRVKDIIGDGRREFVSWTPGRANEPMGPGPKEATVTPRLQRVVRLVEGLSYAVVELSRDL
jgi:hypothetical protein